MGVADKVREGASKLQVAGRTLMFVTLTLGRPADGAAETPEQMLDRLMAAWRRWRQGRWWADNMDGAEYFRVVEAGSQNGRPHVHLVVAGRLPYIRAPHDQESVAHWRADLTGPAAREMVHGIEVAGFGPLCYVERLKGGGGSGAATYLGGYLSKSEKRLVRPDGRTVRVAEGSRGWPVDVQDKTTYMAGGVAVEPGGAPCECLRCGRERDAADVDKDWAAVRRRNVAWWWRHMDPNDGGGCGRMWIATYGRQTHTRLPGPPDRRHLVNADTGAGGGAGGSGWTPPLDVAEAAARRRAAYDALGRIRRRGYDGSVRLLRDMAAAGYDVEHLVAESICNRICI